MAVLGVNELDHGSLYMAQWIIGQDGEFIARRRKFRPTLVERTCFGEGDVSRFDSRQARGAYRAPRPPADSLRDCRVRTLLFTIRRWVALGHCSAGESKPSFFLVFAANSDVRS